MILTLNSRDIFTDGMRFSSYSEETMLSIRALVAILKVGSMTNNSSWIQGSGNQALYFVDGLISACEEFAKENALSNKAITDNMKYILAKFGYLKFSTEYGKRTITTGIERSLTSEKSLDIDELFSTFDHTTYRDDALSHSGNMFRIAKSMHDAILTFGNERGIWEEPDDHNFKRIIIDLLGKMPDANRYRYPTHNTLDEIFK